MAKGKLQVRLVREDTEIPIKGGTILVTQFIVEEAQKKEYTLNTNSSGFTDVIELSAPDISYSQGYSSYRAYSICDIKVSADGYRDVKIVGVQILPDVTAMQKVHLKYKTQGQEGGEQLIVIPKSQLASDNSARKNKEKMASGYLASSRVLDKEIVIPKDIIVHLGAPDDIKAENSKIKFNDYIKGVCAYEIYATWPESAIRTNIYCTISFLLNRIYTDWYRKQGKDFDITSDSSYDKAFFKERNTYANIDRHVDSIFNTYVIKRNRKEPVLTKYCDKGEYIKNSCILKWQSKYLADMGLNPGEIVMNYFGEDATFVRTNKIEGVPKAYPGYPLIIGITSEEVKDMQRYLNTISEIYSEIPKMEVSGNYDLATATAVGRFQEIFNLEPNGIVDFATWYSISRLYIDLNEASEDNTDNIPRNYSEDTFIPPIIGEYNGFIPTMQYPLK